MGEQLARQNPFLLHLRADAAGTYTSIGQLQQKLHKFDEALQAFEQAQSILARLTEEDLARIADLVARARKEGP